MIVTGTYGRYEAATEGGATRITCADGQTRLDIEFPGIAPPELARFLVALYEMGIAEGMGMEARRRLREARGEGR